MYQYRVMDSVHQLQVHCQDQSKHLADMSPPHCRCNVTNGAMHMHTYIEEAPGSTCLCVKLKVVCAWSTGLLSCS